MLTSELEVDEKLKQIIQVFLESQNEETADRLRQGGGMGTRIVDGRRLCLEASLGGYQLRGVGMLVEIARVALGLDVVEAGVLFSLGDRPWSRGVRVRVM